MEFIHPVIGRGLQKTANFSSGMHKIAASPFVAANCHVWIFIKGCSVIFCQRIIIHCKMHWNKVQNDPNSSLVALVYKCFQFFRLTIAGGWTEISCILISPGFVAWVLTERHDLHIIIAVFLQIGDKDRCQFLIGVPVFLSFASFFPGAKMHFINVYWFVVACFAVFQPFAVAKFITAKSIGL